MPEEVRTYTLCRVFGWSEREYLDATVVFSDQALAMCTREARTRDEETS